MVIETEKELDGRQPRRYSVQDIRRRSLPWHPQGLPLTPHFPPCIGPSAAQALSISSPVKLVATATDPQHVSAFCSFLSVRAPLSFIIIITVNPAYNEFRAIANGTPYPKFPYKIRNSRFITKFAH
jgi:hypothetical protein